MEGMSFKSPPSLHRLFDLHGSLDKRMHFLPQLSDVVPLRNGFYSISAHRLTKITLLTLIATLQLQGESYTCILDEETQPVMRAIGISHTACKDEFRQNIRSHNWSVFSFL